MIMLMLPTLWLHLTNTHVNLYSWIWTNEANESGRKVGQVATPFQFYYASILTAYIVYQLGELCWCGISNFQKELSK